MGNEINQVITKTRLIDIKEQDSVVNRGRRYDEVLSLSVLSILKLFVDKVSPLEIKANTSHFQQLSDYSNNPDFFNPDFNIFKLEEFLAFVSDCILNMRRFRDKKRSDKTNKMIR